MSSSPLNDLNTTINDLKKTINVKDSYINDLLNEIETWKLSFEIKKKRSKNMINM
jgi:hypothetical protein